MRVDKSIKDTRRRSKARAAETSTVKKSAATISSRCRVNSFEVVFLVRSGCGFDPVPIENISGLRHPTAGAKFSEGAVSCGDFRDDRV
jgi:hypothetical protein